YDSAVVEGADTGPHAAASSDEVPVRHHATALARPRTTVDTATDHAAAELAAPSRRAVVNLQALGGGRPPDVRHPGGPMDATSAPVPLELSDDMVDVLDLAQRGAIVLSADERHRFKRLGVVVPPTVRWLPRWLSSVADNAVPRLPL